MIDELERVYEKSWAWARARSFAGYDPFDALNSRLFQATPFKRSRLARLVWTQFFKRSPVNLRPLASVPAERNAKGAALFALSALSRFRARTCVERENEARELLRTLLEARFETRSGATAWGYNFDWQGRSFYAPRGTPTIVPTAFAARALVEASDVFGMKRASPGVSEEDGLASFSEARGLYLDAARSACDFILRDLNRSAEAADEICFSYTPLDRTRVLNASLLAGETLASVGARTGEGELVEMGLKAARYVARRQRADGSWGYGEADYQTWSDNFHTAFILASLARIRAAAGEAGDELRETMARGYAFWRAEFFLADGWPKYYHRSAYPADAHSAGASVSALIDLCDFDGIEDKDEARALAERVAHWTIRNLFDGSGRFYYQKRRLYTVRTPYMRWSQAWMTYALARLLEEPTR